MHLERVLLCLLYVCVYSSEGFFDVKSKTSLRTSKRLSTFNDFKDSASGRSQRSVRKRKKFSYNLRKISIRDAVKRQALCLDGSVAAFYLSHNPLSKNWIIQLQAGGSCGSVDACHERAKGQYGSSKNYDLYLTGTFLSSDDPNENPTFASWNKIYVPYCSGDVFVGRKPKSSHPYGLQMLGHYIIKAMMEQLMADYHINSTGNTIVFGGASAGGLGMLANLDYVQNMLSPAKVRGFNDGGWFTFFPNFGEELVQGTPLFFSTLEVMFNQLWDGFVDESCRSEMPKPAACLYGELVIKFLTTPIYVMVAQWDSYQLQELVPSKFPTVRLPPELPSEAAYLSKFGNNTHRSIRRLILSETSGVFSPACFMHTFSGENDYLAVTSKYQIKGRTAYKAFSEWHVSSGRQGTYVEIPLETPLCNPSCCSSLCTKCRAHQTTTTKKSKESSDSAVSHASSAKISTISCTWLVIWVLYVFTRC